MKGLSSMDSTFRKLPSTTDVSTLDQISEELAIAFSQDPLARVIIGEWSASTSDSAIDFFRLHLLSGLKDGEVYVVGEDQSVEGVAVVFGSGKDMNTQLPEWQAFLQRLPSGNLAWYTSFNRQYQEFVDRAYGPGHQRLSSYLLLLGIRPSSQRKGLGTALFRGVEAIARESGSDLCWQTTTAPSFYQNLGFEAISEVSYKNETGDVSQWAYISYRKEVA
ncbi:hypothetical protein B0H14DRAFT_2687413 [Mycena olivaceomarginata]|nr:hypothetical protein B0H14DRAFT_2760235 [Mycena olivaceomarginata]KAJ7892145.1 hypothetical protein B0H14DRAFT_2687413 [Mycena olivaceomarginata]